MIDKNVALQISEQYSAGKRQFFESNLEKANLAKAILSQIDLSNSILNHANLEQADLSNAIFRQSSLAGVNLSRANLRGADFTKADLSYANMTGAIIIGANFAHGNLCRTNLSLSKLLDANVNDAIRDSKALEISQANKVNFRGANLTGAFFMGVDLSSAHLEGAIYDDKTNLAPNFDPKNAGMIHIRMNQSIVLDKLLAQFNHLVAQSNRFLGPTITKKYFNSSRPDFDWLNQFQISSDNQISFSDNISNVLSLEQSNYFQQWIDAFTQTCSRIIKNFPAES
jgi:Pentapeptide repeats (8 copies)